MVTEPCGGGGSVFFRQFGKLLLLLLQSCPRNSEPGLRLGQFVSQPSNLFHQLFALFFR